MDQLYPRLTHRAMSKRSDHHCSGALWHHGSSVNRLPGGEGHADAGAAGGQVVRHWIFNHLQEFLRAVSSSDAQFVQQLNFRVREGKNKSQRDGGKIWLYT